MRKLQAEQVLDELALRVICEGGRITSHNSYKPKWWQRLFLGHRFVGEFTFDWEDNDASS